MKKHVIIVAGGKGLRMGGDIPKQFLPIGGKPVLMRTIEAFYSYDPSITYNIGASIGSTGLLEAFCVRHIILYCLMILPMGAKLVFTL